MPRAYTLNRLETHLKEHDWTYEMSDDHRCWTGGTAHRKQIKNQIESLYGMGLGKKVEQLFYEHYPVEGCHEHTEYGIESSWADHMKNLAERYTCGNLLERKPAEF